MFPESSSVRGTRGSSLESEKAFVFLWRRRLGALGQVKLMYNVVGGFDLYLKKESDRKTNTKEQLIR